MDMSNDAMKIQGHKPVSIQSREPTLIVVRFYMRHVSQHGEILSQTLDVLLYFVYTKAWYIFMGFTF